MGAKQGKHRREDGTDNPSEETSPKRPPPKHSSKGRSKKTKQSPTRESPTKQPPVQVEVQEKMDQPKPVPKVEVTPTKKTSTPSQKKETTFDVTKELTIDTSFDNKENNKNISSQVTPIKQTKTAQFEPVTPLQNATNHIPGPQATSTPAPNGMVNGPSVSPPLSPGSTTDQSQGESDDEGLSPTEEQFRSLSPSLSLLSRSTTSSMGRFMLQDSGSMSRRNEVNFGKFYNTSYLKESTTGYLKRPASNPTQAQRSPNFARPENFTYSMEPPTWMKHKKGMSALASGQGKKVVKVPATSPVDLKNEEPVKMSMYPSARPPQPKEIAKIDREDWPGPPSPAALLPEILRERKKSRGLADDDDEEEMLPKENPQVKREIEELSKLDAKSSIAQAILKSLEDRKVVVPSPLDPWKASRVPSASYEPRYRTRYQSPMFASPSRFLDRPRPRSWDDSDLRGYRSLSASRFPNYPAPKPGYGGWTPKSVTLPLQGAYGGHLDYRFFEFDDSDQPDEKRRSTHASSSSMSTEGGSKKPPSIFEGTGPGVSLLKIQRSTWHTETEPPVYTYEKLKITNFDLPRDVDINRLEIHLSKEEFEDIFKMSREEFYKMAEWKRNDIKRRNNLY
ncbi:actin-binding LIM protein 1-like isoform X2 [Liolophura sinensis]|uniref:actin-binding LIM protein 1-like isoform X2 n=1 Tax=Liolophura sinensis TaxID=3198878 RepID=UPI003159720E